MNKFSHFICAIGLLTLVLLLSGCSEPETSSEEEISAYESKVFTILYADPLADSGLGQMIDITIGDLGCEGDLCTAAVRFQFLSDELTARKGRVADYRGQICKPEVVPPKTYEETHALLCDELQNFFNSLDAIGLNSQLASRMLSTGENEAIVLEFSNRLEDERAKIMEIRRRIKSIAFLEPIFLGN